MTDSFHRGHYITFIRFEKTIVFCQLFSHRIRSEDSEYPGSLESFVWKPYPESLVILIPKDYNPRDGDVLWLCRDLMFCPDVEFSRLTFDECECIRRSHEHIIWVPWLFCTCVVKIIMRIVLVKREGMTRFELVPNQRTISGGSCGCSNRWATLPSLSTRDRLFARFFASDFRCSSLFDSCILSLFLGRTLLERCGDLRTMFRRELVSFFYHSFWSDSIRGRRRILWWSDRMEVDRWTESDFAIEYVRIECHGKCNRDERSCKKNIECLDVREYLHELIWKFST